MFVGDSLALCRCGVTYKDNIIWRPRRVP